MINKYYEVEMSPQEIKDINSLGFSAEISKEDEIKLNCLSDKGKDLCHAIIGLVPNCADRSAAIRYLRLALMQCAHAVCFEGKK